ncbi:molybdopterin biosynthesis MoaE protein [Gemmatirosa kalamazoonensis]|uniref:Molybdopterin synthase catalytic subunit n=1 Tax=Gemmatirosa kalamazoonensis TaxID=861299 RepID=W0RKJ4_9BACT|nr:molybdenum cofactor biosynthesis protein MoaE [Gemmatirosa kalamazoonensis]AHG90840.1 molybdopterin biosynthesis MoaE protein [Gemmatirosa kalamazoonensis]
MILDGPVRGTTPPTADARLERAPLDVASIVARVAHDGAGGTALFVGTVRAVHQGRAVVRIDYEAYEPMALAEMRAVALEVAERHDGTRVAIAHRLGALEVGEASVAIATSHAHRGPALAACAEAIDVLKQRVPIWKREHFADGTVEWVDPTAATAGSAR